MRHEGQQLWSRLRKWIPAVGRPATIADVRSFMERTPGVTVTSVAVNAAGDGYDVGFTAPYDVAARVDRERNEHPKPYEELHGGIPCQHSDGISYAFFSNVIVPSWYVDAHVKPVSPVDYLYSVDCDDTVSFCDDYGLIGAHVGTTAASEVDDARDWHSHFGFGDGEASKLLADALSHGGWRNEDDCDGEHDDPPEPDDFDGLTEGPMPVFGERGGRIEAAEVPPGREDCDDIEDVPDPCWCGTINPLYDDDALDDQCGGSGTLHCRCGGDLCVCHNHGEVDCPGCPDCDEFDEDEDFDDDLPGDDHDY